MLTRLLLICALAGAGCGGDDRPAECEAIVEACHAVDTGTGMIHTCHEGAETDWSREECMAMSSACLEACGAALKPGFGGRRAVQGRTCAQ